MQMKNENTPHHIQSISVEKLFGRYSYSMPASDQKLTELNILYGNNGAGKTTLLNLLFHMLSPSDRREHRTKIADIPFAHLIVTLNDGTVIQAKKNSQLLVGPVHFSISKPGTTTIDWHFSPGVERSSIKIEDLPTDIDVKKLPSGIREDVIKAIAKRDFHKALGDIEVITYMLTSDRMLMGDTLDAQEVISRPDTRGRTRLAEMVSENRTESVFEAMKSASVWVQKKYFEKSYGGGESSKTLYEAVIERIANTTNKTKTGLNKSQEESAISDLTETIIDLDKRSRELSKYGLGGNAISPEMAKTIAQTKGNKLNLINSILQPYLSGHKSRIDGIYPLYLLIDIFVMHVNKFLKDKKLQYSLRNGFKIMVHPSGDKPQEIQPSQLSSGEQQLILLFCYVLVSRDKPSVFIIDEPEISLNILWQRLLIGSLQDLVKDADIQFIFASHSMEILSKHKDRVISMASV
jgi:energy-coupling factor transporter ATP-binding protein EcfA2